MVNATGHLRLGVVGCARILPAHLRGLAALQAAGFDRVRITALCARRREDAATFRRRGEGPTPRPPVASDPRDPLAAPHRYVSDLHPDTLPELYDDWRRMLDADVVDAVLVLAPVALHHQIALDALAAGKHVLIEKPLAVSVRAGRKIVDEGRSRGLVVGVAENLRYAEGVRASGWALRSGLIGEPQLWLSGGVGGAWAPDRIVAGTPWRHRKLEAGGGGAIDVGVHLMHQIRYVMGPVAEISADAQTMEPERVERDAGGEIVARVRNEVEDVFLAHLRFASGAIGTTFWSWAGRGAPTVLDASPTIYGTAGCLKGEDLVRDGGERVNVLDAFARDAPPALRDQCFPDGVRDPFALEMRDFVQAIATGRAMEAAGEEGLLDLAMAFAILESAAANRPARVADVLAGNEARYQEEIDRFYRL